jgi:spore maturation protein SpmB
MLGVKKQITDALPVAMLRPFSSGGSRGFMIDAMKNFGADSFTGRLTSIFQCSAETTFYVIAVYFGSINVKNTRYTLGIMLLVDLICVITAIGVASIFFK